MTVTNAMRLLTQAGIPFETSEYPVDESDLSGVHAAEMLGVEPDCVFKTLVVRGERRGICVFVIPVAEELDLKKCAATMGDKKAEMIHVRELLGLTGYVRGGCSPIGMKKALPTVIAASAQAFDSIYVSAGRIGTSVFLAPEALAKAARATFADIIVH